MINAFFFILNSASTAKARSYIYGLFLPAYKYNYVPYQKL